MFYAHSTNNQDRSDWERLTDHLERVAETAEAFGAPLEIGEAARLAGLLHDLGKFNPRFQARLSGSPERVDHSTAGAKAIWKQTYKGADRLAASLIAHAIAGHHAGLPDSRGVDGAALAERLDRIDLQLLDPSWKAALPQPTAGLLPEFDWKAPDNMRGAFRFALLGRMIFSCLVDADYKETERFYVSTCELAKDRDWPALRECLDAFRAAFDRHIEDFGPPGTDTNVLRAEILASVCEKAAMPQGLFTLNVPTGGGKTLASLGFALDHAKVHGHRRIIYGIPFTSIIDQTATIFRKMLGEEFVLEHHAAIEDEPASRNANDADSARSMKEKLRLAMEDWAAPVVVTTHVQLFESLFAARPSRCRKLHNIARSVIILDEAQTLPKKLLAPTVWAIDELARNYGCSIVLCTATQPAFDKTKLKQDHWLGLDLAGRELAPDPRRLHERLRRTRLDFAGELSDADLVEALADASQALVIVNSRRHALDLYRTAERRELDGLIHLTTRQYAAHRRRILAEVRQRLESGKPCRLIATSLIEAGVDVDFPVAWRAEAGLDQIAQAAGRVNREGNRPVETSIVTVFKPADPDHTPPAEIKSLIGGMERMKDLYENRFAPDAIERYFQEVYWQTGERIDAENIRKMVSVSKTYGPDIRYRKIAKAYRMIEDGMAPVIVAIEDDARNAVEKLKFEKIPSGAVARDLQVFTVLIPPKARSLLIVNEHVNFEEPQLRSDQFAVLRAESLYTKDAGLLWENAEYLGLESPVI